jgi:cysteinyl-tRNA synthetase
MKLLRNDRRHLSLAARVLGFLEEDPRRFLEALSSRAGTVDVNEVERMIEERSKARASKDWGKADAIRERLLEMGIVLEDGPQGTTWRYDV